MAESRIDPALLPYLQTGLQRAQELFLTGPQPTFFPGQTYVAPSEQTLAALTQQEQAAAAGAPVLQQAQQAYQQSLGQIGTTAAGGFLGGSPYREALIQAATRPLVQQYEQTVLPGIASGFSRAGRYGSGAMEQAQARATEAFGRSLGDVSATLAAQDYARERGLQQQAQIAQSALAQAAPSFFQSSFLPAQALSAVGAAREQIALQPLQEQIARFNFGQITPRQSLQTFLSSVYGSPMAASNIPQAQTNQFAQALGGAGLGYIGGSFLGGTPLNQPGQAAMLGGLLGGLGGYFG
jgi:outer membrane lipoprotein SlyB